MLWLLSGCWGFIWGNQARQTQVAISNNFLKFGSEKSVPPAVTTFWSR